MINYRKGTIDDLSIIIKIEEECFNELDRFSQNNIKRMILNPKNSIIVDIIQFEDDIIGYAVYLTRKSSKKIRLYSICILPQNSGRGFAREYLDSRIRDFTETFSEMTLEVRFSNLRAIKLYSAMGFKEESILPCYYSDEENGVRMVKRL